jgi:hypothetical protein
VPIEQMFDDGAGLQVQGFDDLSQQLRTHCLIRSSFVPVHFEISHDVPDVF